MKGMRYLALPVQVLGLKKIKIKMFAALGAIAATPCIHLLVRSFQPVPHYESTYILLQTKEMYICVNCGTFFFFFKAFVVRVLEQVMCRMTKLSSCPPLSLLW